MDVEEALAAWRLWCQLPSMVKQGLITEEECIALKVEVNDKLHEALGLS